MPNATRSKHSTWEPTTTWPSLSASTRCWRACASPCAGLSSRPAEPRFQAGPLSIDFARRHVELSGQEVSLTPTEFDLLKVLIVHRGKILTRQMLLKEVWGEAAHARTHSLHVYVALLRQKIEPLPDRPRFIITIPGVGYRFSETDES